MKKRILFLPGAGGDPAFWHPLGNLLPNSWDKSYLGWPGLGHQKPNPAINRFEDLVTFVESSLGESPVDLIAQSMGGAIALRVAHNHPGKVRRLVLTGTSGGLDTSDIGATDWRSDYQKEYPNAATWILDERPDFSKEMPKVTMPTLLLWGGADTISPTAVGERLLSLLPEASLMVVPKGDHSFAYSRPMDIVERVRRHLE